MKKKDKTIGFLIPRLPIEALKKLKRTSRFKSKKEYDRKREKRDWEE